MIQIVYQCAVVRVEITLAELNDTVLAQQKHPSQEECWASMADQRIMLGLAPAGLVALFEVLERDG